MVIYYVFKDYAIPPVAASSASAMSTAPWAGKDRRGKPSPAVTHTHNGKTSEETPTKIQVRGKASTSVTHGKNHAHNGKTLFEETPTNVRVKRIHLLTRIYEYTCCKHMLTCTHAPSVVRTDTHAVV
jgi:hypothetical protein